MALHMLLQMGRLLEPHATLFAIMADLLARSTISSFLVILQTIHFILMVLEDMGADQTLLGPNHAAELALVPTYIPPRRPRPRRRGPRAITAASLCPIPHLTNPQNHTEINGKSAGNRRISASRNINRRKPTSNRGGNRGINRIARRREVA